MLIVVVLGLGYGCEAYKFRDCKKVGHSTLYCIMKLGD